MKEYDMKYIGTLSSDFVERPLDVYVASSKQEDGSVLHQIHYTFEDSAEQPNPDVDDVPDFWPGQYGDAGFQDVINDIADEFQKHFVKPKGDSNVN